MKRYLLTITLTAGAFAISVHAEPQTIIQSTHGEEDARADAAANAKKDSEATVFTFTTDKDHAYLWPLADANATHIKSPQGWMQPRRITQAAPPTRTFNHDGQAFAKYAPSSSGVSAERDSKYKHISEIGQYVQSAATPSTDKGTPVTVHEGPLVISNAAAIPTAQRTLSESEIYKKNVKSGKWREFKNGEN